MEDIIISTLQRTLVAGTPLLLATTGEIICERSGILNLGVEGVMALGAVTAFIVTMTTGSPWLGVLAALVAGMVISIIHAVASVTLQANQVVSGLALTMLGLGLSGMVGKPQSHGNPGRERIFDPVSVCDHRRRFFSVGRGPPVHFLFQILDRRHDRRKGLDCHCPDHFCVVEPGPGHLGRISVRWDFRCPVSDAAAGNIAEFFSHAALYRHIVDSVAHQPERSQKTQCPCHAFHAV